MTAVLYPPRDFESCVCHIHSGVLRRVTNCPTNSRTEAEVIGVGRGRNASVRAHVAFSGKAGSALQYPAFGAVTARRWP